MNEPHDPNPTTGFGGATTTVAVPLPATERYTLGDEIARGGMGVVYRATDTTLGREVAVKVLQEKYGPESGVARRFADEARITSQLQHPSIPPVHDLGSLPDGRPFLAMKLIKGQTLEELLKDRPDPGAERGRFVAVFEQICQALAYAHAHQVIHRDLKPANVMVGHFGEVQVMDWGLAKVLQKDEGGRMKDEPEQETLLYASFILHPSSFQETQAGSVLGTPAFMPPEQAVGATGKVDARSDVFGLGAVLAVILTGKPPFAAATAETTRVKAAQGDVAECLARLDACGAEPDLVALCKRCLSPKPADRPSDADAVARAVAELRVAAEERARQAELARVRVEGEKALAEAREAEQRKRRRVQLALAAAVVGLLLGGGAFAWWQNDQAQLVRQREGRNAEAVAALLDQSEEALRADDAAKATVALDAARKRSAEGGAEEQAPRLGRLDADLALVRDLDAVDQFRFTWMENSFADPAVVATRTREALKRVGADPDAVSADDAAARVSASVVRERIVTALDLLLRQERTAGVHAVLRRVDADPYRDAVRDAVLANDWAKFAELAGQEAALEQPPGFAALLGDNGVIKVERRRQLLQAAVSRRSGDLGLLMMLGSTYLIQKDGVGEQLRWFQAAIAAAPANYAAHINLGWALRDKGRVDEAIVFFKKAIELDPKLAMAHNNLGVALMDKGKVDEAIACWRKAIELDPKHVNARFCLGFALQSKGQVDEAIACYRKVSELDPKKAAAHSVLGVALHGKGEVDEAIVCYKKAIALDPKLALAHDNLGKALVRKGQVDEAIACWRKAIELDPKLANAHNNLGWALGGKGQMDEAIACWRKAIELDPKLTAAHTGLGVALIGKGQVDEAIACYRKVIELDPKLARAHYVLGVALHGKGEVDEAIVCYKKAIALDPKNANAHFGLGSALRGKGQLDEAIACWKKAIEFDPKFAGAHFNLGIVLRAKGDPDGAMVYLKEMVRLTPNDPWGHGNLGFVLFDKKDYQGAAACYREVIRLAPQSAKFRSEYGLMLRHKGDLDEAIAQYREALRLDPKYAGAQTQLAKAERLAATRDKLAAFQNGSYTPASNEERLDLAEWCGIKKLHHTATGLYAAAFAADPKLADDLGAGHRYNAACRAALAAVGQGEDAAKLDDKERTRLLPQALDWLKADRTLHTKQLETGQPADRAALQQALRHWQQDADLAGIRDATALAKLPADEQKAFTQLWAGVAALLQKAEEKAK